MIRAWHILKSKHALHALDGEGSRLHGGRWNSPGVRMVYASQSLELAVLEILVHLQTVHPLAAYVVYTLEFDASLLADLSEELPGHWRDFPAPVPLQQIGDRWIAERTSVVLEVPSAVLPSESNYLFNPEHNEFQRVNCLGPTKLDLDPRLFGRR